MRKQVPELENWVEAQTRAGANYMIVGDWNRDLKRDLMLPARLTEGQSAKSPITADTKIGSMMKELSDDEPKGSYLTIATTNINARKKTVRAPDAKSYDTTCHQGIDSFVLSDSLMKMLGATKETLSVTGADYGAEAYGVDKAMPSDHCPVTLKLQ
jgi:exonuclease III